MTDKTPSVAAPNPNGPLVGVGATGISVFGPAKDGSYLLRYEDGAELLVPLEHSADFTAGRARDLAGIRLPESS